MKRETLKGKITPCFGKCAKDFIIPSIYFTSLQSRKTRKFPRFFPGSFAGAAHMRRFMRLSTPLFVSLMLSFIMMPKLPAKNAGR